MRAMQEAKNENFYSYITQLSSDDHSLWKATKKFKRPITSIPPIRKTDRTWARSSTEKVEVFAEHLVNVFSTPQQQNNDADIKDFLHDPHQLSYPIKAFSPTEVYQEINY
jgi:hypothetical protein